MNPPKTFIVTIPLVNKQYVIATVVLDVEECAINKNRADSQCKLNVVVLDIGSETARGGNRPYNSTERKTPICRLNPKAQFQSGVFATSLIE